MSTLQDIGTVVHARRKEMGLSQALLARRSGLSRVTVNQLEQGRIKDLSVTRAARLLESIGLSLSSINHDGTPLRSAAVQTQSPIVDDIGGASGEVPKVDGNVGRPRRSSLEVAAQSASVSYSSALSAQTLAAVLAAGESPPAAARPHLATLLDEAPVVLLARVVDEVSAQHELARAAVWSRMRELARGFKSRRDLWS